MITPSTQLFILCFMLLMNVCTCSKANSLEIVSSTQLTDIITKSSFTVVLLVQNEATIEAESSLLQLKEELETQLQSSVIKLIQPADIIQKFRIQKLPSILFFRRDKPVIFDGPFNADDIFDWILQSKEIQVQVLTDDTFEHLTQAGTGATTGDWLVLFCNLTEQLCTSLQPIWDSVSSRISARLNVAFVDTFQNTKLITRFKIEKIPEIIFFRLGKMYRYTNNKHDISFITSFATKWFRDTKAEKVPLLPSAFDNLIDGITIMDDPVMFPAIVMLGLPITIIMAALYAKRRNFKSKKD
uniref:Uncharacterized protein n=1 Tax=Strigamia maritima TaxID=126957 RepID=T1IUX9_STRMM